jgi:hypothetical protein
MGVFPGGPAVGFFAGGQGGVTGFGGAPTMQQHDASDEEADME